MSTNESSMKSFDESSCVISTTQWILMWNVDRKFLKIKLHRDMEGKYYQANY